MKHRLRRALATLTLMLAPLSPMHAYEHFKVALYCRAQEVVHMAEPDESNSRYWYRMAGRPFPGLEALQTEMAALEVALRVH